MTCLFFKRGSCQNCQIEPVISVKSVITRRVCEEVSMSAPSIRFVLLPCEACGSDSPPGISAKVSVDSFSAHLGGVRNSCPQNAIMSLTISKAIVIIPSDTKQIHLPIFPYRPSYLPHHIDDVATAHNPAERVGASTGQNRQRTPCRGKEVVAKLHWAPLGTRSVAL